MSRSDADYDDYLIARSRQELERFPRRELPHVVSRDYCTGAADPFDPDDYHELPNLLRRQAA